MNINLYIERLILDGLPVEQGEGGFVGEALETELTRMLIESGLAKFLRSGGAFASLPVDPINANETSPHQLGQKIARSMYGGIGEYSGRAKRQE